MPPASRRKENLCAPSPSLSQLPLAAPYGVQRLRVTELRFSLATGKRERKLVIGMVEQLAGVMAVHAGIFQRELQLRQQLIDPLVQFLGVEFQRACDFGDRARIP